jgi:hypothetical protein
MVVYGLATKPHREFGVDLEKRPTSCYSSSNLTATAELFTIAPVTLFFGTYQFGGQTTDRE